MKKSLCVSLLVAFTVSVFAQITSTFDTDADGWTYLSFSTPITVNHQSSGGNPGGYVSVTYSSNASATTQNWIAPSKFWGNHLVRSLGMNLKFDLQQSQAGTTSGYDVRVENGGTFINFTLPVKPAVAPAWSSYTLSLDENTTWKYNGGAANATRAQIKAILVNVTSIEIRGAYATNAAYTSGLDNVILEQRTLTPAPVATSLSTTSGKPGDVITISGSGFNTTPSANTVSFGIVGGVKAVVQSATASQLTVVVPQNAAYGPLVITNNATGLSTHTIPFSPLFEGGGRIIRASFKPKFDIPIIEIEGVFAADVDGDGWTDLAVANNNADDVIDIYRNLGLDGILSATSFASKVSVAIPAQGGSGTNGTGLWFADLDGDGKLDAISSNSSSAFGSVFITLRNTSISGTLSFEAPEYWAAASDETPIALVADLDGDGRPELMSGEGAIPGSFWFNQNISVPGNIEFGNAVIPFGLSVLSGFAGVNAGDLNGDGKPELIVNNGQGQSITVLQNTSTPGAPSFLNAFTFSTNQYNSSIHVADLNLDGKNDFIYKVSGEAGFHIRINSDIDGSLTVADFATDMIISGDLSNYGGISIADVNGDGKPDIAACDNSDAGIYENVFAGGVFDVNSLVPAYQYEGTGISTYPTAPMVTDLNGDGKPEIIIAFTNTAPNKFSIYENVNIHAPLILLNTVSPLSGAVGSTVTITGSNFSTVPSANTVWFGTVKATVLTATANELTVSVPPGAGYSAVSVTKAELTSTYHLPFQTTFSSGVTFNNTHFAPPVEFTLTGADYDIDVGDLDNDGLPDVVAEGGTALTSRFRNTHTSGPITTASLTVNGTNTNIRYPRLQDLDGDGYLDMVGANRVCKNNSTTGNISFQTDVAVANVYSFGLVDYGDLNRDGKTDMVVTDGSLAVDVVENRTANLTGNFITGTFSSFGAGVSVPRPGANGSLVVGDFDNDGHPDMIATNPTFDNISIFRNAQRPRVNTTSFATSVELAVGDNPDRIYTGDFDLDGKLDVLLHHGAGTSSTLLIVLHNQSTPGNISFNRIDLTNPSAATVAHVADLDGDGKPEIITTSEAGNRFSIFKNLHTTGALTAASFAVPFNTTVTAPRGITTGDLNLDGKPEIILTRAAGLLVVYENLVASFSPPVITSIAPLTGPVGTSITISGNNFNSVTSQNIVYFGSTKATVTSAIATELIVTVPDGAKTGSLIVTDISTGLQAESPTAFSPTFSDGGRIIPASLATRVDINLDATVSSHSYLRALTAADLDDDGWNDLITFQGDIGGGAGVAIYRNLQVQDDISVNSFSTPIELPLLPGVSGVTYDIESAKDLDGDGKLDLAFIYRQSSPLDGYFVTYRNISTPGNIAFEPAELFNSFNATNEFTLRMADIDGDGQLDFLGTNQTNTHFFIAQNISTPGNINFGAAIAYAVADLGGFNASYSATGFLNDDNKIDVVLSIDGSTQLMILENTSVPGTISFAPGIKLDLSNEIAQPIIADINNDGKNDIIWRKTGISEVGIRLNSNTGGALSAADFATQIVLTAELLNTDGFVTVGDINGDGKKDIICTDSFDMLIFENVHEGGAYTSSSFVEAYNWRATGTSGATPAYPMTVDLDGDQKPEVVTGISNSASPANKFISIFKNINTHAPAIAINTVSPLKGSIGSTVTITGDYFSTIPSENLVRFGSIKATVTAATRTQLSVTVPAGVPTGLVSVTRDALTSTYRLPFVPTFSNGVFFDNTHFAPPVNFTATSAGINVGVSDLNGDGKPDVMVNNTTGSNGYAFRNTHVSGAISLTSLMPDDTIGRFTHFMDFDGDGLEETMGDATLYRNVSVGLEIDFAGTTSVLGNGTNRSFGDYNADGKIDLVGVSGVALLFAENETQPGFQVTSSTTRIFKDFISLTKPASGGGTASADFDNDGLIDIAATNSTLDNVSVFRNTGAYRITPTQFTALTEIAVGDNPYRIYASDLDVDGKMDLLVIHQTTTTSQFVTVLHNQSTVGNISFTRFDYSIGVVGTEANISDLDGDGRPDILVTSETTDQFFIIKNTSSPGVMNASSFATPFSTAINNPRGITAGDLNLDGKPEIIVAGGSALSVYENLIISSCVPVSQRNALIALYNSTDGANWTNNTNWLSADESTWTGVSVTGCNVTGLVFQNNNLNGSLPVELGDLTELTTLSITLNPNLSGTIPGTLGNLLPLTNLQLWNNNLTGPIPTTLGNLTNLVRLELLNNQLTGNIPSTIGNITSLEHLQLSGNLLTGTIPNSLFGLTNLKTIELGANQLTGSISPSFASLTNLESLGLSGNQLSGNIPTEIGNMTSLTRLVLAVNLLTGSLPSSLGNLVNLNSFTVFNNQLSGTVPSSLSNLVNLNGLGLSVNQFTGDLPAGIGLIPNLSDVSVRDNDFTSIPTFISTSFTDLLVYGNKLNFAHLEPNIGKTGFVYSPQDNLPGGVASACEGSTLTINFSTPGTANQYQWYKDGSPITGANSANFSKTNATVSDAGNYTVEVTNAIVTGLTLTSDSFVVTVIATPCSNQPPIILSTTSGAQIEGRVTIDLLSLISDPDNNLDLSTLSIVGSTSEQGASVNINSSSELILDYSGVLFTGIDHITIEVCDLFGACVQQELEIEVAGDIEVFNALSPNGDEQNDFLYLKYIELFPETQKNRVNIFNRWGDVVWEGSNYDNSTVVFDGTNTNGKELPSGTYFFKIDFGSGRESITGFLSLKR